MTAESPRSRNRLEQSMLEGARFVVLEGVLALPPSELPRFQARFTRSKLFTILRWYASVVSQYPDASMDQILEILPDVGQRKIYELGLQAIRNLENFDELNAVSEVRAWQGNSGRFLVYRFRHPASDFSEAS